MGEIHSKKTERIASKMGLISLLTSFLLNRAFWHSFGTGGILGGLHSEPSKLPNLFKDEEALHDEHSTTKK